MTQWVKCDDGTIIMQKKIKFFGVMRIEPEIVCAGWLEENVHMCQLKSRLLVGLHVTVVYVIANNVREKNVIANKHAVKDLRSHLTVRY